MTAVWSVVLLLTAVPDAPSGRVLRHLPFERADGTTEHASVYLPHGYDDEPEQRYPVLILLHGLGGEDTDWLRGGYFTDIFDRAIASGRIQPLIVVMPNGGNGYWTDWLTDAEARFGSLVEPATRVWVNERFRTDGRVALGGVSMGGFGALSVALRHPERFAAVLSFSGALFRQAPTGRSVYLGAFGYPGIRAGRFAFINPIDLARLGRADHQQIWLDCGESDLEKFTEGLREMSAVLRARGVRHVARFRPGRHTWDVWLSGLDESLPWLNESFERALFSQTIPIRPDATGLRAQRRAPVEQAAPDPAASRPPELSPTRRARNR